MSAITGAVGWTEADVASGLTASSAVNFSYDGTTINTRTLTDLQIIYANISGSVTFGTNLLVGDQVVDLGKEKRFTVKGDVIEIWRKVQLVRGQTTNGVPRKGGVFYVATYNADTTQGIFDTPIVARMG
jgi:hypothetical protein